MNGTPRRQRALQSARLAIALPVLLVLCARPLPWALTQQAPAGPAAPATAQPRARGNLVVPAEPIDHNDHEGWTSLFDGRTLTGWDGNPAVWKVESGAIVAASTADRRVGTTFLIWQGGDLTDFELKLEVKLDGDIHSGITYRGRIGAAPTTPSGQTPAAGSGAGPVAAGQGRVAAPLPQIPSDPKWTLSGAGLDYDANTPNAGNCENRGGERRGLCQRGSVVLAEAGKPPRIIGSLGDADALLKLITPSEWTQVHIVVRGNQFMHIINGRVMAIAIDDDPTFFVGKGTIGLQIEGFGLGQVNVRSIWLKRL
jgi:hypothetical protein